MIIKKNEVRFVDGLLEMYKLRGEIAKARAELTLTSAISAYPHKFGTSVLNLFLSYRSTLIDLILEKKKELDWYKKVEASRIACDFLILQHASLKCILEQNMMS